MGANCPLFPWAAVKKGRKESNEGREEKGEENEKRGESREKRAKRKNVKFFIFLIKIFIKSDHWGNRQPAANRLLPQPLAWIRQRREVE